MGIGASQPQTLSSTDDEVPTNNNGRTGRTGRGSIIRGRQRERGRDREGEGDRDGDRDRERFRGRDRERGRGNGSRNGFSVMNILMMAGSSNGGSSGGGGKREGLSENGALVGNGYEMNANDTLKEREREHLSSCRTRNVYLKPPQQQMHLCDYMQVLELAQNRTGTREYRQPFERGGSQNQHQYLRTDEDNGEDEAGAEDEDEDEDVDEDVDIDVKGLYFPKSLQQLCMRKLCRMVSSWANHPGIFKDLPSLVAQKLFEILVEHRMLDANMIMAFQHCYLSKVNLHDLCIQGTKWCNSIAKFYDIRELDLSGCPLLTDVDIAPLCHMGNTLLLESFLSAMGSPDLGSTKFSFPTSHSSAGVPATPLLPKTTTMTTTTTTTTATTPTPASTEKKPKKKKSISKFSLKGSMHSSFSSSSSSSSSSPSSSASSTYSSVRASPSPSSASASASAFAFSSSSKRFNATKYGREEEEEEEQKETPKAYEKERGKGKLFSRITSSSKRQSHVASAQEQPDKNEDDHGRDGKDDSTSSNSNSNERSSSASRGSHNSSDGSNMSDRDVMDNQHGKQMQSKRGLMFASSPFNSSSSAGTSVTTTKRRSWDFTKKVSFKRSKNNRYDVTNSNASRASSVSSANSLKSAETGNSGSPVSSYPAEDELVVASHTMPTASQSLPYMLDTREAPGEPAEATNRERKSQKPCITGSTVEGFGTEVDSNYEDTEEEGETEDDDDEFDKDSLSSISELNSDEEDEEEEEAEAKGANHNVDVDLAREAGDHDHDHVHDHGHVHGTNDKNEQNAATTAKKMDCYDEEEKNGTDLNGTFDNAHIRDNYPMMYHQQKITSLQSAYQGRSPRLRKLVLSNCVGLGDHATAMMLAAFTESLETLDISFCTGLSHKTAWVISQMFGLRELNISKCTSIPSESLGNLSQLSELEKLSASMLPNIDEEVSEFLFEVRKVPSTMGTQSLASNGSPSVFQQYRQPLQQPLQQQQQQQQQHQQYSHSSNDVMQRVDDSKEYSRPSGRQTNFRYQTPLSTFSFDEHEYMEPLDLDVAPVSEWASSSSSSLSCSISANFDSWRRSPTNASNSWRQSLPGGSLAFKNIQAVSSPIASPFMSPGYRSKVSLGSLETGEGKGKDMEMRRRVQEQEQEQELEEEQEQRQEQEQEHRQEQEQEHRQEQGQEQRQRRNLESDEKWRGSSGRYARDIDLQPQFSSSSPGKSFISSPMDISESRGSARSSSTISSSSSSSPLLASMLFSKTGSFASSVTALSPETQASGTLTLSVTNFPSLKVLDLSWTKIGDSGFAKLASLPNVEKLNVSSTQCTSKGLATLLENLGPNLRTLNCDFLSDALIGVTLLRSMTRLCELSIRYCSLAQVAKAPETLQTLDASGSDFARRHLEQLGSMPGLRCLNLHGCVNLDRDALGLIAEYAPGIEVLDLGDTDVDDLGVCPMLRGLTRLTSLNLFATSITERSLSDLVLYHCGNSQETARLQHLNIDAPHISDNSLSSLHFFSKSLRSLDLFGARISDRGCRTIYRCQFMSLESLAICGGGLTDDGAESLCKIPSLKYLGLSQNALTNTTIHRIIAVAEFRNGMISLNLAQTQVTDEGVLQLSCMCALQALSIGGCKVSQAARNGLEHAVPTLRHIYS